MSSSLLKSTMNTRFLPGQTKYIRTDLPYKLTKDEIDFLYENNFTTVIDLRTTDEFKSDGSILEQDKRFTVYNMPITLKNLFPMTFDELKQEYIDMVDKNLSMILDFMMSAKTNVIYYCWTGKDRTGVISAMLLKRLGYDKNTIIADYMESMANEYDFLVEHNRLHPDRPMEVLLPNENLIIPIIQHETI